LRAPFRSQQLSVLAHFSDGSVRDVTELAAYDSSHPSIASADEAGRVTGRARGQAAISVRYLERLESVTFAVVEEVPGFVWKRTAETNLVDRLGNQRLQLLQYEPGATCSDSVFLRRIYLALTGLLPSPAAARRFLADPDPGKRARLVDALLETEEFARFWALKRADLLRVSPQYLPEDRPDRLAEWLVDSVRRNLPYDEFARRILTATGDSRREAAAGYFLAIPTPEERTEMTAQLFLGSRLECARCHNHPFENWTLRDYYRIAAVFARTRTENGVVRLAAAGETLHPTTREPMAPWAAVGGDPARDRRADFAAWLTRPGNPYFARVEANRIWAELFGRGIVEPVDDFRSSNPPANGKLLDALGRELERSGYDRKHLIRLICNSQTFQRTAETTRFNVGDETLFSHFRVSLLSAEQMQDAIRLATRTLPAADQLPEHRSELAREVGERTRALDSRYAAWLQETTAAVAALPVRAEAWRSAGPFPVSGPEAGRTARLGPEQSAGEAEPRLPDGETWKLRPEVENGSSVLLSLDGSWVTYFQRRILAADRGEQPYLIQANEVAEIWLNGEPTPVRPGRRPGPLTLALKPGENRLLVKLVSS
ncbi:MAG: DUF1549 domain-containing protein, partial [Armatimonadetes bacterium]|nr:DUF1549 domain-containing protein [Armatimonadota bacterium]